MNYKEQCNEWLKKQKKATTEQKELLAKAWMAGYLQCSENWCRKER